LGSLQYAKTSLAQFCAHASPTVLMLLTVNEFAHLVAQLIAMLMQSCCVHA